MSEAIQASMREYEEQQKTCPHCGSETVRYVGTDRRVLLMGFGRVVLSPRRLRCQHCKHRFRPADVFLSCYTKPLANQLLSRYSRAEDIP